MIRRSRPKYINIEDIDEAINISTKFNKDFYFDRGSSAFKFLLKTLVSFYNKNLIVCIQSFNCNTILDAALEVENIEVILSDVKLSDYSVSLNFLKLNVNKIDVLLLLHYQGMINSEYDEIISFCFENNIIVIEDLAHMAEDSFQIKGDFGMYSYSFDKPYTSYSGGKIIFKSKGNYFYKKFKNEYYKLDYEDSKKSNNHLKTLKYLYIYSDENLYFHQADNQKNIELLLNFLSIRNANKLLRNKILGKLVSVVFKIYFKIHTKKKKEMYPIKRILDKKIYLISKQKERYFDMNEYYQNIKNLVIESLNSKYNLKVNKEANWNRLSFIDESKLVKLKNIEYGNFNWQIPLNVLYKNNKRIELIGNYENSIFLSKYVVNFPIWSENIKKEIKYDE